MPGKLSKKVGKILFLPLAIRRDGFILNDERCGMALPGEERRVFSMVTGIVLVNVDRSRIQEVIRDAMAINGVTEVYTVAGEYDLVFVIRVQNNAQLGDILATKMTGDIPGILHSKTLVTLNAQAKVDLEKLFG